GARHRDTLGAVHRDRDVIAAALQPAREHVPVHLIVFDEQDLRHGVGSRSRDEVVPQLLQMKAKPQDAAAAGQERPAAGAAVIGGGQAAAVRRAPSTARAAARALAQAASASKPSGPTQSPATYTPGASGTAGPGRPARPRRLASGTALEASTFGRKR